MGSAHNRMKSLRIAALLLLVLLVVSSVALAISFAPSSLVLEVQGADRFIAQSREDTGNWLVRLGVIAVNHGNAGLGMQLFQRVAANPADAEAQAHALHNIGVLAFTQGQREEALDLFRKAIVADATYARAHYSAAIVQFHDGAYGKSIPYFERYASLADNDPHGWYDLGVAIAMSIQSSTYSMDEERVLLEKSQRAFTQALTYDPAFPHAQENLQVVTEILSEM